jgi:hypothetical protein
MFPYYLMVVALFIVMCFIGSDEDSFIGGVAFKFFSSKTFFISRVKIERKGLIHMKT